MDFERNASTSPFDDDLIWPHWPLDGSVPSLLLDKALNAANQNKAKYAADSHVISFPGTEAHPYAIGILVKLASYNMNHIGVHTAEASEKGFKATQQLEKEGIQWLARILGDEDANGYVAAGGTEANIMGLWIGRNMLRKEYGDPLDPRVSVLSSFLVHYSIRKACNLLDLGEGRYDPCPQCKVLAHLFNPEPHGGGLDFVTTDENGAITDSEREDSPLKLLRRRIEEKIHKNIKRFIIVANAGTTITGAVDDIPAISRMLRDLEGDFPDVGFYLHVDAAFGGLVGPFIAGESISCGFTNADAVASVAVDPHKMGLAPYPSGILLVRRELKSQRARPAQPTLDPDKLGLLRYVDRPVGYVGGHHDCTLSGSRSGAIAVATSLLLMQLDQDGYASIVANCVSVTRQLATRLDIPGIKLYRSKLNVLGFAFDHPKLARLLADYEREKLHLEKHRGRTENIEVEAQEVFPEEFRHILRQYEGLCQEYTLMGDWLPENFFDLGSRPIYVHKIIIMPHPWIRDNIQRKQWLMTFCDDIRKIITNAEALENEWGPPVYPCC